MLFLTYWELNENMPVAERMGIAQKLTSSGLFPPKGVKILRWDETPDAYQRSRGGSAAGGFTAHYKQIVWVLRPG